MHSPSALKLLDWITSLLRWVTLISMALVVIGDGSLPPMTALWLAIVAVWSVIVTFRAIFRPVTKTYCLVSVAVDLLAASILYAISGTTYSGLGWAGILPLISASLYFPWKGALLITLLNLFVQGLLGLVNDSQMGVLVFLLSIAPVYLGFGFFLSIIAQRMLRAGREDLKATSAARQAVQQTEVERRRVIYTLMAGLSASLNYQRVLETSLDLTAEALSTLDPRSDHLVSAVFLFSGRSGKENVLSIGSARRLTPSDLRTTLPGRAGLIGESIEDANPHLSRNISKDPELSQIIAIRACNSAYCLPLRSGLDTYGVMLFAHPEKEFFNTDRREILDLVANQAMIALQNARLYQDLEKEKERMTEIQEEARKKMARDLHDGPTQSVAAIAMRVNFARRLMERDQKAAAEEMFKIEDLARRTTKEIRHMLFTLRPLILESQGLVAALEAMAEKMQDTYSQKVIVEAQAEVVDLLEAGKQAIVFYIAEEAVNNARKHARAPHIWVRLKMLPQNMAFLEIEDDGAGFNLDDVRSAYDNRSSLGMVNMRERAELVNGVLNLDSAEGEGTRVQLVIPLDEDASDRLRRGG